jgi:hypothetical protein
MKDYANKYTQKQLAFIDKLLCEIGFDLTNSFAENYKNEMKITCKKFKAIGNSNKIIFSHKNKIINIPENFILSIDYNEDEEYFSITDFNILNFLLVEKNIKKNKLFAYIYNSNEYISASDISNYVFCPANYSISKTLKYNLLHSSITGTEFHDKTILSKLFNIQIKKMNINVEDKIEVNDLFNDSGYLELKKIIHESELIFSGHGTNEKTYFKSKNGKYIGQPDYIFKNKKTNKIFVIEEKYQYIPNEYYSYDSANYLSLYKEEENKKIRESKFFYENHIYQTLSYIYGINDFNIDFGILLYWKYEIDGSQKNIKYCNLKIINRSEEYRSKLNNIYSEIISFKNNKNHCCPIKIGV